MVISSDIFLDFKMSVFFLAIPILEILRRNVLENELPKALGIRPNKIKVQFL